MRLLRSIRAQESKSTTVRKDGRVVAVLTVTGDGLTVEAAAYPPGSTQREVPLTMYGRRSTWRGPRPSSVHVGHTDNVTTGWAM